MITRNHRQEALCRAYVHGVAALAGLNSCDHGNDYGIDLSLRTVEELGNRHEDGGTQVDLQLRSTTRAHVSADSVRYDLDVRTYDLLRRLPRVPRILVVLVLPDDERQWLTLSSEELVIRHAAYWYALRGAEPIAATSSIRLTIPRTQLFDVVGLRALMLRISQGEMS